ncbi:MAG: hypothetical protein AAF329_29125 [Cyanobacteria bacterium P01_A01_bin.17]
MSSSQQALKLIGQLSLASVLMLPGMGFFQASASAEIGSSQDAIEIYYETDHGYCDAQMLSAYWGNNTYQAKAKAGEMLLDGQASDLEYSLTQARRRHASQVDCWYGNDGFDYEDAVALANYWNVSIGDAKTSLGNKLEQGNLSTARWVVQEAHASAEEYSADDENLAVFVENHSYCDAQMLSAYWGKSAYQAKLKAGQMMRENAQFRDVKVALQRARNAHAQQVDCRYTDEGFDYDDAVAVANYWQTSVGEAKVGIEQKLKGGYFEAAKQLVQTAHQASAKG